MGLALITPPVIEPLTLAEARAHLRLGAGGSEPAPAAPVVALADPAAPGNVDDGSHRYQVTFVTSEGETEASPLSDAIDIDDQTVNGQVAVMIPIGGSQVIARKVYRSTAGSQATLLLATINDNVTTAIVDNTADVALGAGAPAVNPTPDPYLLSLIEAAREFIEDRTNRALLTQTWELTLDRFPCSSQDPICLPKPKLLAVDSVTYVDVDGQLQTLSADDYTVDGASLPGQILLNYGRCWPSTRNQKNAVTIRFQCGYGAARSDVPAKLRSAMKLILGDLNENREGAIVGTIRTDNPTVAALIAAERYLEIA